jgi:phenylacetate-CoA ligase
MAHFFSNNPHALEAARETLRKLRSVPALAPRYVDVVALDSLEDLIHVPVMVKDDLNVALDHLKPRAEHGATWTFQSGGSTGSPKLGYAPSGLHMDEVYAHWQPLGRDDIFVNGWGAGKLWGAHPLMAAYADLAGCVAIGLGVVGPSEYDTWLQFFADRHVTAIGATPSALRPLFGRAREIGFKLIDLRSVLFLGEAWTPALDEDMAMVAPNARRWGLFGSTETWVVGTNTPDCAADTYHPLPSQLVHVSRDQLLDFTSLKPRGLNPVLRYRTGDAGEWVSCTCGASDRALRVLGRRDNEVKFRGLPFNVDALIGQVSEHPGVSTAQLVMTDYPATESTLEVLVVPARDASADLAERVRRHLLALAFGGPGTAFHRDPAAFTVRLVEELISNERTGKTTALVHRQAT